MAIVAVIIVALWFVMKKPAANTPVQTQTTASNTATSETASVANAMPTDPSVSSVKSSGSSDAALASDSAAIDAQMNGFASDTSAASTNDATTTK